MKTKFIIPIIAAVLIIYFVFIKKGASTEELLESAIAKGNCITPPANFKKYNTEVNWGDFGKGVSDYLVDDDTHKKFAHGFLKGINVEARSTYVKYYQDEIRAYMKSSKALPHWEVIIGQYNCEANGAFPKDVILP
jgi:hypothetical protein